MPLPHQLFTPAFRHRHLGRSFAVIVGIMVFIATFATAAEAVLLTAGHLWRQTVETRLTVEIPAVDDESAMTQGERVKQALSVLRAIPDIEEAKALSDNEVARLLEPWFSKPELLKTIALPALIDIRRLAGSDLSAAQIQAKVRNAVSDARVDDHGSWARDVRRLVNALTLLGGLTILLTGITLAIAVSLICRTVIADEHETISLLHLTGADDQDIARHFQSQSAAIARHAASLGFLLALIVALGLLLLTQQWADFSPLSWSDWLGVLIACVLVPVVATVIAAATARLSVLRLIKSYP